MTSKTEICNKKQIATHKEALNTHRTMVIDGAFEPVDPEEELDIYDNEEYQREAWLFGEKNL